MICRKCKKDIQDGSAFCNWCGTRQEPVPPSKKKRGNGQGSVFKLPNGKYKAVVVLSYETREDGKKTRKTKSATFETKKEAVAALPRLRAETPVQEKKKENITFAELYRKWFPTHRAGKSTMSCYKSAFKHFEAVYASRMSDIDIDDLQECLDSCGKGKRTQENMKALCGLIYKFGIPRNAIPGNLNLAQFLVVGGDKSAHRESFTDLQLQQIKNAVGSVPYADYIYCITYLGFRPSEALALRVENYDRERQCFVAGSKTEAGINRVVTISPKVYDFIISIINGRDSGYVFCDQSENKFPLKTFTEDVFYPALEKIGIENPMVDIAGGVQRHKYTPHTMRHTFSTLMKRVDAPSKDKLQLIGHSSEEMLRYYQDVSIEDLKKITDAI